MNKNTSYISPEDIEEMLAGLKEEADHCYVKVCSEKFCRRCAEEE